LTIRAIELQRGGHDAHGFHEAAAMVSSSIQRRHAYRRYFLTLHAGNGTCSPFYFEL
jgi:hypothetical protein